MFENTIRKYNGVAIDDDCTTKSAMFRDFAKMFRREVTGFKTPTKLVNFRVGHYDVSGYLNRGFKYIYFTYSVPRGGFIPVDMHDHSAFGGIMFRVADDEHDTSGGFNHFTDFFHFEKDVNDLFEK